MTVVRAVMHFDRENNVLAIYNPAGTAKPIKADNKTQRPCLKLLYKVKRNRAPMTPYPINYAAHHDDTRIKHNCEQPTHLT